MTKEIQLTQGKVALVDDSDYEEMSKYRWYAHKDHNTFYAHRKSPTDPVTHKRAMILMHAVIIGASRGMDVDHINGDGLDNRRCNIRIVTRRQNLQNLHIKKTSKYPGVHLHNRSRKWQAQIRANGKWYYLGQYDDEATAALRYQIACDWQVIDL